MNQTPAQQWTALSALYEQADAMAEPQRAAWLDQLQREGHPLLARLRTMLDERGQGDDDEAQLTRPRLTPLPPPPAADHWQTGDHVGRYRLERPLGEGGMAEVWLAERDDGALKRRVAIKLPFPRPGRHSFEARFGLERDILATLRHPNIAGLFDAGVTEEGQAWIALEYVEGLPLSTFSDTHRLDLRERMGLFRQVLLAVQHAHANLVIHRDLKPGNILVTAQGEVRLLDFGIAKLLESETDAAQDSDLTRAVGRSLTPRYASPEQLDGRPLTTASDVYSLGVVFYELMSGQQPYELKTDSTVRLEQAILEFEPRAPSRRTISEEDAAARRSTPRALARALSPEIDAIALRCMEKRVSARYLSVDSVLADVDRWLSGEAVLARTPSAWYRAAKFAARHRIGVGLGIAAIAGLIGVTTMAVMFGLQAREDSARAGASRDFMLSLFKRADQEKSRGADITARELLDTGRKDVLSRLGSQPRLQAELLQGIATIQEEMGEFASSESSFGELVGIYRRLGMPRETVLALAGQANSALRLGNPALAMTLVQQAKEVPGRPSHDLGLNARLTGVEGWIANIQTDATRARELFSESRRYATAAFGPNNEWTMDAISGQIYAERLLRNFRQAIDLSDQLDSVSDLARVSETTQADHALNRAELLIAAGQFATALDQMQRAVQRCNERLGSRQQFCRRIALNLTKVQVRLGLIEEARGGSEAAVGFANDAESGATRTEALLLLLRLNAMSATSPADATIFERVRSFAESGTEVSVNPALKMRALLGMAEARLISGDWRDARRWLSEAEALQRRNPAARPKLLTAVAGLLDGIAVLQSNDQAAERAYELLVVAQQKFDSLLGSDHAIAQLFRLNISLALLQLGHRDEALRIVLSALPTLRNAFGEQSPVYRRVLRLRDATNLSLDADRRRLLIGEFFS